MVNRMTHVGTRSVVVLLVMMHLTLLPGCRRASDDSAESLTVLYDADERVFGPYWSSDAWFLMFLPLVTWDERGEVAPRLAQSWERSPDSRDWTFYLRSDVRWHDGVPTTAHDVKFTIEFQGRPDILYEDAYHDVDSILVHDDTTLSIHYARSKDALNEWVVYWPKHIIEQLDPQDFLEWEFWTRPVGNGPFRYVRHVPKTMVELEANADFYAGKPAIDRVRLKFGGGGVAVTELLSGNVDVLTRVNRADLLTLSAEPRFRIYHHLYPGVPWLDVLAWNHRHPAFSDTRVRRALTMGLDRGELHEFLGLPVGSCLTDVLFTHGQCRSREIPTPIAFDPDGARTLLADAGWSGAAGDNIRAPAGRPLSFTVLVSSDEEEAVAVFSQAAFRRIGVDMRVRRLDRNVVRTRVGAGDFEAAILPYWNHVDGHIQWLGLQEETRRLRGFPDIGYRNPEVDRLLAAAKETVDPDGRGRIFRELAPYVQADIPITFLYPQQQVYVAHRRLRGFEIPYRADPITFLERLWLER
jgi:peptide/nickel transport system substrate-binding protein